MAARKGQTIKTEALLVHAKRQALARYGIDLKNEELRHLVNIIRMGGAEFIERKSLRVSCWRVAYRGFNMVVLYDRSRRSIVTFLPADCWEVRQRYCPLEGSSLP